MHDPLKYSDVCGMFGKIPQQADFVNLHIAEPIAQAWHRWVANSISVSREQLGEQWLDYYLTSPVWHFVIAPGALAPSGIAGVMIPSVDSIGRYFPLFVGAMGHFNFWQAAATAQQWFGPIETYALNVLEETLDYPSLVVQLEQISLPNFYSYCSYQSQLVAKELTPTLGVSVAESPDAADLSQRLFNLLIQQHYARPCLWWTKGSDHIAACMRISDGIPDAGQFAALLDGQWQQWGWQEADVLTIEPDKN